MMVFRFAIVVSLLLTAHCALLGIDSENPSDAGPQSQVFEAQYERVWRAAQLAFARYPIKVNNMDAGILETDFIKREKIWIPPFQKRIPEAGERHQISLRMTKGVSDSNKPAVRVTIIKSIEILPDFFSTPHRRPSDGLEERTLLYRIDRELKIEQALQKATAQDQNNK